MWLGYFGGALKWSERPLVFKRSTLSAQCVSTASPGEKTANLKANSLNIRFILVIGLWMAASVLSLGMSFLQKPDSTDSDPRGLVTVQRKKKKKAADITRQLIQPDMQWWGWSSPLLQPQTFCYNCIKTCDISLMKCSIRPVPDFLWRWHVGRTNGVSISASLIYDCRQRWKHRAHPPLGKQHFHSQWSPSVEVNQPFNGTLHNRV